MKKRLVTLVFGMAVALVNLSFNTASAASHGYADFVGKMTLTAPLCYPILCPTGPLGFQLFAGPKKPDPNGGPSACVGFKVGTSKAGKGTGGWGPDCDINAAGTISPGVFGGSACADSTGTIAGAVSFDAFPNNQSSKNQVAFNGAWPLNVGGTIKVFGVASKPNGETGPFTMTLKTDPDSAFKGDSCSTGANDFRVVGHLEFSTI